MIKKRKVLKLENNRFREVDDSICQEGIIRINLPEGSITASITAENIKEFVYGHLFSEGYIKNKGIEVKIRGNGIIDVDVKGDVRKIYEKGRVIWTECGEPPAPFLRQSERISLKPVESDLSLNQKELKEFSIRVWSEAKTFKETGGTHIAGIICDGKFFTAEDIGRHNAVDKVIGRALLDSWDFSKCAVFTSGRISADIVAKAVRCAIPIIASKSAALGGAIELADRYDVCLIGFLRGDRMNVYSARERISG